jgi:hypothetical protein
MLKVVMLNVVAPLLRPEPTVPSLTISIGPSDELVHPSPKTKIEIFLIIGGVILSLTLGHLKLV